MKLIIKLLSLISLFALAPLAILSWGTWFDNRGGEPYWITTVWLLLMSPVWFIVSGIMFPKWLNGVKVRYFVIIAATVLYTLMTVGDYKTRRDNSDNLQRQRDPRQERTSVQQH